ncbi:hypothetical protein K439DRAFT_1658670 [Ramaria rubella]|nr:hypothetical protein K439DRAFT_1658670 [Ramaria rubella]
MPQIFLPLDSVAKCHACGGGGKLKLCSGCAERAYCSPECQTVDWGQHRGTCKTDRIDLTSFYPVLACIAEATRLSVLQSKHPALRHQIVNSPNPDEPVEVLPDGSSARIVKLGSPVNESLRVGDDASHWWPAGQSAAVRHKLMRRIAREGKVLPIVMSTCLALMLSIYSTTTGSGSRRVRLRYRSSPVSDFGIVKGSARVTPEDTLAYILPDKSILKGQDPNDHYWIYFETQKGEEVVLDCSMFTFNMCLVLYTHPYRIEALSHGFPTLIPAWFKDRTMTRGLASALPLLMERERFSVLRDESIQEALKPVAIHTNGDLEIPHDARTTFTAFMSRVAGRPVGESEQQCFTTSLVTGVNITLDAAIRTDKWKHFPAQPQMGIETDPGEVID